MSEDKRMSLSQPAFVFYEQKDLEEYMKNTIISVETAAIMKCVEVCNMEVPHRVAGSDTLWMRKLNSSEIQERLRALIPQDGRTQLDEFGMKVANEIAEHYGYSLLTEKALRAIVTNLIGEKK